MSLIFLLFLHHLADVAFQPSWLIEAKKKHAWAIFEHVMIYAGTLSIGLWLLGMLKPWHFWYFLVGHFIIDFSFYRIFPLFRKDKQKPYWFVYPDQALHYAQILLLFML